MHFSHAQFRPVFALMHFSITAESLALGLVLRQRRRCRQRREESNDACDPHHGVSHIGACGGFTTRILVALSFLSSAISASDNLKSNTSILAFR